MKQIFWGSSAVRIKWPLWLFAARLFLVFVLLHVGTFNPLYTDTRYHYKFVKMLI